jgi:AraC family transcriptional regulator
VAIERINFATGRRESLARPDARVVSRAEWTGLAFEHLINPPAEWAEGQMVHDHVAVLLSESCVGESSWPGVPRHEREFSTRSISVLPARMPFRHRNFATTESFHVAVGPEFVSAGGSNPAGLRPAFGEMDPLIASLLVALCAELRAEGGLDRLYAESFAAALVTHLGRKYPGEGCGSADRRGGLPGRKLRTIQEYVESHLEQDLGLVQLAAVVRMNVDSFLRAFRQSTGTTPYQFILRQRILRAQALLRVREIGIRDVSTRCGFRAQGSFTRAFHRLTGTTPRHYRNAL